MPFLQKGKYDMPWHTMYPGTGSEQVEGKNPICKCLNRFELLVPVSKELSNVCIVASNVCIVILKSDPFVRQQYSSQTGKKMQQLIILNLGYQLLTTPQQNLVGQFLDVIKRGARTCFKSKYIINRYTVALKKTGNFNLDKGYTFQKETQLSETQ